jgi:propionyl-CoA carboxylase alpha chain
VIVMTTDTSHSLPPIDTVLVANRGEIARRIIRTCRRLGITTVAVHSDADADAPFVADADVAIRLPGDSAADTYLRIDRLLDAAARTGAQAIHPGYGFLSERPDAAEAVERAGLRWIGPPPAAIAAMGSKVGAKELMRAAGVPVLPDSSVESLDEIGLPAIVKASAGGGGRGMRIVRTRDELDAAITSASQEAAAAFGDGTVFVERYVEGGRHVEIQVFADLHGNVVSLFERDCTLQRRHQKIIEESPSPAVDDDLRARMGDAAVAAARAVGYVGAGTVEFLLDRTGRFSFLEMNTRLQVEHPVTEMLTGLDLVELQLAVANGEPLPPAALAPSRTGHAIEVRLCAEDPADGYRPSIGTFTRVAFPGDGLPAIDGVRVDTGIVSSSTVPPFYDSMVAKLIAHAPTRAEAARRLAAALRASILVGPVTNREQLLELLDVLCAIDDVVDTTYLDRHPFRGASPISPEIAAVAAVAVGRFHADRRTVLRDAPTGWRNVASQPVRTVLVARDRPSEPARVVEHHHDRTGAIARIVVDGVDVDVPTVLDVARHRPPVVLGDDDHGLGSLEVHLLGGRAVMRTEPRFVSPDQAGRAGSLVAPMPGTVRRVLVAVGDAVTAGQPLVTIEAMKMEHQIIAPAEGAVDEVLVAVGDQVDTGQSLIRLGTPDS